MESLLLPKVAFIYSLLIIEGLFTTSGKPAEWILPVITTILGEDTKKQQWYQDFKSGYRYSTPVLVDAFRFVIFLGLGYYANALVNKVFDNDAFWGWSSGIWFILISYLFSFYVVD